MTGQATGYDLGMVALESRVRDGETAALDGVDGAALLRIIAAPRGVGHADGAGAVAASLRACTARSTCGPSCRVA